MATFAGIAPERGPTWPNSQCRRPESRSAKSGQAADTTARSMRSLVVRPDLAIDHVGADGQADPAPRRRHDQGRPPRVESEAFPEHKIALAIDVHITVGRAKGERIVEMPPLALDESRHDRHLPLPAALAEVRKSGAFRRLTVRPKVGAEAVAGVEKLGQGPRAPRPSHEPSAADSSARCRLAGTSRSSEAHLHRGHCDLHGCSPRSNDRMSNNSS